MRIGRNQYLIAPVPVPEAVCADTLRFGSLHVYLGADCRTVLREDGENAVLLLGYAVDAAAPERDERELCDALLRVDSKDTACAATDTWGGRWVLCLRQGDALCVWADACGLKQVFFCGDKPGWLASQARYLAQALHISEDPEAKTYLERAQKLDREYAFPLDRTLYGGVRRLLPGHRLCADGRPERFFCGIHPAFLGPEAVWPLLCGGMQAVLRRYPAAVTVTAGLDSRLVLAAAPEKADVQCFTFRYADMPASASDLVLAAELCDSLSAPHTVLECTEADPEFQQVYTAHGENGHVYWMQTAEAWLHSDLKDRILIKGSCNEVNTNPAGIVPNALVTASLLCRLFGIPETGFSKKAVREWLKEARAVCRARGCALTDRFYLEHRCGSWLAACLNEQDIAGEMFTPFNVRLLPEVIRLQPVRDRIPPEYTFFRSVLRKADPRFLQVPINPGRYASRGSRVRLWIKYRLFCR